MYELPAETIARLHGQGWGYASILSALGHPGYGARFAKRVCRQVSEGGVTVHQAVYSTRPTQAEARMMTAAARASVTA